MKTRAWATVFLLATTLALAGPAEWRPGDKLKDATHTYELVQRLGSGSFVQAWEAKTESGETVVLRIYSEDIPRAFEISLRAVARLQASQNTPNLLRVSPIASDSPSDVGTVYFHVAERAEHDLGSVLERDFRLGRDVPDGNERVGRLHGLMLDLLRGMTQLHSGEIVHGDIKPENILRVQGRYVLGDFDHVASPQSFGVGCTAEYCPPGEIWNVGREYDYWSTASTLVKSAVGRTPKEIALPPPHRAFHKLTLVEQVLFPNETEGVALRAAALERLTAAQPSVLNRAASKQFRDVVAYVSAGLRVDATQRRNEVEALLPSLLNPTPTLQERCDAIVARAAARLKSLFKKKP